MRKGKASSATPPIAEDGIRRSSGRRGVAHDFNNMLSVILGRTGLALERIPPDHLLFDRLRNIQEAAQRSADLTRQLLTFARKQTVAPKVLDLNATVANRLKMLERLIGEDIVLLWHPGADISPIRMDPSQLDQLLVNLCVNSRDAIESTGTITITTGFNTLDETFCADHPGFVPGDFVTLTVSAGGTGMSQETFPSVRTFFPNQRDGQRNGPSVDHRVQYC